jgi:hypothetical protein
MTLNSIGTRNTPDRWQAGGEMKEGGGGGDGSLEISGEAAVFGSVRRTTVLPSSPLAARRSRFD